MGKLESVFELIKKGVSNPREIAEKLNLDVEEVEGIIKILESLGYVEKVELGSSICERCPLKKICPGSCIRFKGQIYHVSEKSFRVDLRE
ncbi:DNA-binding protein [Thermococcus sp. M39]|uniref:DNA-binding protein n=1 Tax=unclassified Thermococcus TaxID=2627626 RepID=UPI00143A1C8C|nr:MULTISPECIES: DNA-binding protein [unclassified Thermococcus]NJE07398.1 DNA-binding protein [Thermococcus sp. M39]NJE12471.1 DNA-binding protein [Thermococcus sp. LS2]